MNVITRIEVQKKNKNRVNVYIDEEFTFGCSTEIVYRQKLASGSLVDEENLKSIVEEDNYIRCKNDALKVIERSYKTEKELRGKLFIRGYDLATIDKVIIFLKEYNFVDDGKFAEMYIKEKVLSEGIGKIKFSLARKGISDETIKNKIQAIDSESVIDTALTLGTKKYEILLKNEKDKRKISKKLGDYLLRRGYSFEEIKSVIAKITKDSFSEE